MTLPTKIRAAVAEALSRPDLPTRFKSRKKRWKEGRLGIESIIALLEWGGYEVELNILKPAGNGDKI